ncbi:BTAD domain-containing putative transcriptional regulator [Lawsonibacter sp.]|uniref:BTAD domain-containing putative transcriptional regulator n=1 Tax=Lawsonibacter sp. TaxID=2185275 RepID=UPI002584A559|nr:BTAD domain-containing putative transcriptional regulator [Lawsonibacter sp.]MCI6397907.1 winged helix-turn-helix domain-containing protein [Lawsonibacter sp.]MDY2977540.1 BTAD domain-containing putative transcriptional regulator [Oscillospiraceae bacterium]
MGKNAPVTVVKRVAVTMLGGFRIRVDGNVLTDEINRSQKLWNVLCYLIAHRERTVPQSEFIELFWPEENSANPTNALKTLLYRVRSLLEPLFGEGLEPILSQRGAYAWNPAIACEMDVDRFELLCRRAQDTALPAQKRMALYEEAAEVYRGDYLPKLANQMWVVPISAHYHTLYLEAVKEYADLLEHAEKFEAMAELCTRASQLDPLDESLHTLIVRALLRQGKDSAALSHYEKATDLLYRNLGVRPSEELRALYREIMDVEERLETNLEVIQANLREAAQRPGAFVCEYGFFKEAYRLEARRSARSGACVHIALVTVSLPDGGVPPLGVLNTTMDQLLEVLVHNLRRGDVVSKYSGAQYVVMLPAANFEDSTMVVERIVNAFYRQHRRNFLKLTYRIRELS